MLNSDLRIWPDSCSSGFGMGFRGLNGASWSEHQNDKLLRAQVVQAIRPTHDPRISNDWSTMSEMATFENSSGSEAEPLPKSPGPRGKKIQPQRSKRAFHQPCLSLRKIVKILGPGLITGA